MLFAGWQVRMVKNSVQGHGLFTIWTDSKPANNLFIFFLTPSNQCFVQERLSKQKDKNLPVFTLRSK